MIQILTTHSTTLVSLLIAATSLPLLAVAMYLSSQMHKQTLLSSKRNRKAMVASVMLLQNGVNLVIEGILCIKFCLDLNISRIIINLGLPLVFSVAWLIILNCD